MSQIFDSSSCLFKILTQEALTYDSMRAFGEFVRGQIKARGWSQRDFAAKVEPAMDEDVASGYVSKIVIGKIKPPLKKMERWADALRLDGPQRDRFLLLADLARGEPRIEKHWFTLEQTAVDADKAIIYVADLLSELLKKHGGELPQSVRRLADAARKRIQ